MQKPACRFLLSLFILIDYNYVAFWKRQNYSNGQGFSENYEELNM